jgi:hypothetical protein
MIAATINGGGSIMHDELFKRRPLSHGIGLGPT